MLDFAEEREPGNGWGFLYRDKQQSARTYTVYYNKEGTSPTPPFNSGYGHSFRFKFTPILDVNTYSFIKNIDKLNELIIRFVRISFIDLEEVSTDKISAMKKWQNAVLMFNTAYEFASIEKYDSAVIILHTILESIFLNNEWGSKKVPLSKKVSKYLVDNNYSRSLEELEKNILDTYDERNKFIHEGFGYDQHQSFRSINDHQGIVPGMKPFAYNFMPSLPSKELSDIKLLFEITIRVLTKEGYFVS
jgi:hypothetical protein